MSGFVRPRHTASDRSIGLCRRVLSTGADYSSRSGQNFPNSFQVQIPFDEALKVLCKYALALLICFLLSELGTNLQIICPCLCSITGMTEPFIKPWANSLSLIASERRLLSLLKVLRCGTVYLLGLRSFSVSSSLSLCNASSVRRSAKESPMMALIVVPKLIPG